MVRLSIAVLVVVLFTGCAHSALSGADLDRVQRPAFISRIEERAGPRSEVFSDDGAYKSKLKKLDAKEADRRLINHMRKGMSRFEVAEHLRATTFSQLPKEHPWTNLVDPVRVAGALQTFLVEEVPANPPDYDLLGEFGTDAIVEFVIEEYGMRSDNGRAGVFVEGYGRMFLLDGRKALWYRAFRVDQVDQELPHLDPFRVAKDPVLFRQQMGEALNGVAQQFAKDLQPADRRGGPSLKPGSQELQSGPDDTNRTGREEEQKDELPSGDDLPAPD